MFVFRVLFYVLLSLTPCSLNHFVQRSRRLATVLYRTGRQYKQPIHELDQQYNQEMEVRSETHGHQEGEMVGPHSSYKHNTSQGFLGFQQVFWR